MNKNEGRWRCQRISYGHGAGESIFEETHAEKLDTGARI